MADNMMGTHENDVIFNMDSLREFIKLIKRQGTENIDFYAVSELLQPPGDNIMVSVPTGTKDGNLEPWIELYNDGKRQNAETNLLNYFSNILTNGLSIDVYQYIPEIQERNYREDEDGISIRNGYHIYRNRSFQQIFEKSEIITTYFVRRDYDLEAETWVNHPTPEEGNQPDYTQDDFNTKFQLMLESSVFSKIDENSQEYSMNFYNNLNELLSNLSNKTSIQINGKTLWLSMPPTPTGNKPELVFALTQKAKQDLINVLSAYFSYNNQINIRKDVQPITVYQKEPIDNPNNEPWWKFIYTKYNGNMVYEDGNGNSQYYTEFVEDELKVNPGKIVVVRKIHPWQNNITNSDAGYDINIKSGRHLYIQAGSLLKFNPGQSTDDKDLIDDYWTDTTPGTFSIDENDGQKAHIITIRGFDQNGNFNNKNPIIGYTTQNDIPDDTDADGAYKIGDNDGNYNLTPEQLAALQQQPDVPVYLNGEVIGYIKSKDIPKESDENGAYEINDQKYDLDPNLIIPIAQAHIEPVYLNNNDANITTHELTVDKLNFAGDSTGDKTKFLRSDSQWANELFNSFCIAPNINGYLKIGAYGKDNTGTYGTSGYGQFWYNGSNNKVGNYYGNTIYCSNRFGATKIFNAVFNDYAECRKTIDLEPGRVVIDNDDGSLSCANARLLSGAQVISDTFGNLMGETDECHTPIAVAGRVLVYTYQPRENYHAGMAVCSAPNGTIDIMTREEIKEYPDCIVGIVSEIPNYERWGTDQVDVNGRIWIKIK